MKWVYCPRCRHKLFLVELDSNLEMEIKCHSCKMISHVEVKDKKIKAVIKQVEAV